MKKIIAMVLLAMFSFTSINYAQTTKPAQHLKKDGTPDKRFKENKPAPKPVPLKKDGTPDKRFKVNNPNAGKKKKS